MQGPTQGETLEAVYEKFNIDHPTDYKGHSLSVSDIVVLHQDGENTAHFVDSFGFTTLPEFLKAVSYTHLGCWMVPIIWESEENRMNGASVTMWETPMFWRA